jgi:serine/threonine protein kinase/tetratricopeptide (TPR) repeat protein
MIGTTLTHYRITAKLGEGGMGEVYRATDTKLGRDVAIKVLPANISRDAQSLARFEREAKALAALNHPHIAGIYGFDAAQGTHFLVLELVEGETLSERLRRGPLPLKESLALARQIAEAIQEAHEKGIIHRDLKPGNVKITPNGRVKVLDFGLAKMEQSVRSEAESASALAADPDAPTVPADRTQPGAVMGTPAYMSPEQARGQEVDKRTDIWAFGCCLFECLSGRKPFEGKTTSDLMASVLKSEPNWDLLPDETPAEVQTLLRRCLEKEPPRRLSSIGDIAILLDESTRRPRASSSPQISVIHGSPNPPPSSTRALAKWLRPVIGGLLSLVIGTGVFFWMRYGPAENRSIAVLPFDNLTSDKENEYLSDGITEQLIDALAQVDGLNVPPRTSAFVFKNKHEDIRQIGGKLRVAAVLEGSLRQAGNKLRVTVGLTRVDSGFQIWSQTYDWERQDPFVIQEEIARIVLAKLNVQLRGESAAPLVQRSTENGEAMHLYLKGLFFFNRRTETDLNKAKEFFQQAIEVDPKYALAFAGVADCYNALAYMNFLSPTDGFPKARAAASKAIEINRALPAAHAALGYYLMYHEFDFRQAEREFQNAIELNPNYVTARHYYAIYLTAVGRLKDARAEIERAQKLDVLSVPITTDMGFQLHYAGHQEEAVRQLQSALEMNPQFPLAHFWLGRVYTTQQQYEKALAEYEAVPTLRTWQPMLAAKGFLYGMWGKPDAARKILAEFESIRSQNRFVTSYGVALVHMGLGETESALDWLEMADQEKSHWLVWLKLDPRWNRLRSERRFQALVEKIGLDK